MFKFRRHPVYAELRLEDPIHEEVLAEGSDVEEEASARASKRRRILGHGYDYLNGHRPRLLSAALKGPFNKGWTSPWSSGGNDTSEERRKRVAWLEDELRRQVAQRQPGVVARADRRSKHPHDRHKRPMGHTLAKSAQNQRHESRKPSAVPVELTDDSGYGTKADDNLEQAPKQSSLKESELRTHEWLRRQVSSRHATPVEHGEGVVDTIHTLEAGPPTPSRPPRIQEPAHEALDVPIGGKAPTVEDRSVQVHTSMEVNVASTPPQNEAEGAIEAETWVIEDQSRILQPGTPSREPAVEHALSPDPGNPDAPPSVPHDSTGRRGRHFALTPQTDPPVELHRQASASPEFYSIYADQLTYARHLKPSNERDALDRDKQVSPRFGLARAKSLAQKAIYDGLLRQGRENELWGSSALTASTPDVQERASLQEDAANHDNTNDPHEITLSRDTMPDRPLLRTSLLRSAEACTTNSTAKRPSKSKAKSTPAGASSFVYRKPGMPTIAEDQPVKAASRRKSARRMTFESPSVVQAAGPKVVAKTRREVTKTSEDIPDPGPSITKLPENQLDPEDERRESNFDTPVRLPASQFASHAALLQAQQAFRQKFISPGGPVDSPAPTEEDTPGRRQSGFTAINTSPLFNGQSPNAGASTKDIVYGDSTLTSRSAKKQKPKKRASFEPTPATTSQETHEKSKRVSFGVGDYLRQSRQEGSEDDTGDTTIVDNPDVLAGLRKKMLQDANSVNVEPDEASTLLLPVARTVSSFAPLLTSFDVQDTTSAEVHFSSVSVTAPPAAAPAATNSSSSNRQLTSSFSVPSSVHFSRISGAGPQAQSSFPTVTQQSADDPELSGMLDDVGDFLSTWDVEKDLRQTAAEFERNRGTRTTSVLKRKS